MLLYNVHGGPEKTTHGLLYRNFETVRYRVYTFFTIIFINNLKHEMKKILNFVLIYFSFSSRLITVTYWPILVTV